MSTIWRLNIKPDSAEGVDPRQFCFGQGILGIGWPVDENGPMDWDTYYALGEVRYGDKRWRRAANAINQMAIDDLCWTRDDNANYYLGRILDGWEYRSTNEYRAADIVNVRPCEWFPVGGVDSVPGKVVNSFRPSATVQRVDDATSSLYSKIKFNLLNGETVYDLHGNEDSPDLFSLISTDDCEDIVGLYLQEQGYRLIPSSCKRDTGKTEFVLQTATGRRANVQVKQGSVALNLGEFRHDQDNPCEWFLLTTQGAYYGTGDEHVTCLSPDDMREFAFDNRNIMSNRVQTWIDFCKENP